MRLPPDTPRHNAVSVAERVRAAFIATVCVEVAITGDPGCDLASLLKRPTARSRQAAGAQPRGVGGCDGSGDLAHPMPSEP